MTDIPLMAPDMSGQVQQTINEHPEIDTMDEAERGAIIDITDWRVNGGVDRPWGRKARTNNPTDPQLNTDGMTYLRPDGLFEIYDCISGTNGQATWDGYGPFAQGENGYWWPPQPVEDQPLPPPETDYQGQIDALHDRVETLETNYALLEERLDTLEATVAQPRRAHGPVDLPIVLESLTSLRCKGDIDVAVTSGEATPPPASTGEPPSVVDAVLLKRLLDRLNPEA
jgi:hypothetical protein